MGTSQEANIGSVQRSHDSMQADGTEQVLLRRVAELEAQLATLRAAAGEQAGAEARMAQLREANENLLLAAVNAQSLRDDAEAANRRQNEFLAMLAHELRNPLAPISMAATLLERIPNGPPQLPGLTGVIARQVGHMAHLLDDLLDAARISSGKITLTIEPVLLLDVIEQAVETVQPRVKERQQRLRVEIGDGLIVTDGDRVRLTQVFTNLLANASKYTGDKGEIKLSVMLDAGAIVTAVEDNGSGIAPEVLPHIFDLFTQGPRSLARSEGGLGVGLNVVRNLVAMHNGAVRGESGGLGCGSRFTVTLPLSLSVPAARPAQAHGQRGGAACSILLVEDNADACDTLRDFLALEGHHVATAHDGRSGLALALERRFDVVICDIGLPGLDGYAVIQTLHAACGAERPFAVALSGYCQAEDRARALAAGFDHYFVKPVGPDVLLALIGSEARLAGRSAPQ